MRKIEPKQDFLLCEMVEEKPKSRLITSVKEDPDLFMFRVLAVGPGKLGLGGVWEKPDVEPGDIVILNDRGNWVELEPPTVKVEGGFKKSGGLLLITWNSVAAKIKDIPDGEDLS